MSVYTEVSISGYNASPPPDDGSAGSDNEVTWDGIKSKLADPLKTAIEDTQDAITTAVATLIANLYAPSGTLMLFQQTAAPTGWTKQTTHDDKALRVVSGTASSGGTNAFTTALNAAFATSAALGGTSQAGAGSAVTFPQTGHTHTVNLDVQYVDFIIAAKAA